MAGILFTPDARGAYSVRYGALDGTRASVDVQREPGIGLRVQLPWTTEGSRAEVLIPDAAHGALPLFQRVEANGNRLGAPLSAANARTALALLRDVPEAAPVVEALEAALPRLDALEAALARFDAFGGH